MSRRMVAVDKAFVQGTVSRENLGILQRAYPLVPVSRLLSLAVDNLAKQTLSATPVTRMGPDDDGPRSAA